MQIQSRRQNKIAKSMSNTGSVYVRLLVSRIANGTQHTGHFEKRDFGQSDASCCFEKNRDFFKVLSEIGRDEFLRVGVGSELGRKQAGNPTTEQGSGSVKTKCDSARRYTRAWSNGKVVS